MNTKLAILTLTILLVISGIAVLQAEVPMSSQLSCDFIFFSDPHIGQELIIGSGKDNLSCLDRYSLLMTKLNEYQTSFIINGGDCIAANTMQGNTPILQEWYGQYVNVTARSSNLLMEVKGNHDFNLTLFTEYIGPLNWAQRFGDIFIVGIGTTIDNGIKWTPSAMYDNATNMFLAEAISSEAYRQTTYHFLFMHYQPNSRYVNYLPPASTLQYLSYFNIVFCGHNAGPTTTFRYNGVRCIHTAHLGDSTLSTVSTDEYVTVNINRNLGKITVTAKNFWLGTERVILT